MVEIADKTRPSAAKAAKIAGLGGAAESGPFQSQFLKHAVAKGTSMKRFRLLLLIAPVLAAPAFAKVTITSPTSGAEVISPFQLTAAAANCSRAISSIGYSIDNGSGTRLRGSSINTKVAAMTGAHTVQVTGYGREGAALCESSVAFVVVPDPTSEVPADASVFQNIQALSGWQGVNDAAISGGMANGTTQIVSSPSLSGAARQFSMQFTNYGAERYSVVFGSNTAVSNFLYDGWVYIARPSRSIGNLEMDTDQVLSDGDTVIMGFQCDGDNGTWDYTENAGTPKAPVDHWLRSQHGCNPRSWSANAWHHVQATFSRDQEGTVTYESVWFDGVEQDINETVPSDYTLNWATVLLTNFQIDGYAAEGSATVYLDNLTIYAW